MIIVDKPMSVARAFVGTSMATGKISMTFRRDMQQHVHMSSSRKQKYSKQEMTLSCWRSSSGMSVSRCSTN